MAAIAIVGEGRFNNIIEKGVVQIPAKKSVSVECGDTLYIHEWFYVPFNKIKSWPTPHYAEVVVKRVVRNRLGKITKLYFELVNIWGEKLDPKDMEAFIRSGGLMEFYANRRRRCDI